MTPAAPPPTPIAIVARCDYDGGFTTATVTLHIQRGVWPRPVYACPSQRYSPATKRCEPVTYPLPAGQRVRVLQRVGAGWDTFEGVAGTDGRVRVNGEIIDNGNH